jgi:hypothetical protein
MEFVGSLAIIIIKLNGSLAIMIIKHVGSLATLNVIVPKYIPQN